jgi:hypothetical protein
MEILAPMELVQVLVEQVDRVLQDHQLFQQLQRKRQDQLVHYHQSVSEVDQVQVRLLFRGLGSRIYN